MSTFAYIYLIQDGKDIGTNIHKIGRSLQKGGDSRQLRRLQTYSPGTIIYNLWKVDEQYLTSIEKKIIQEFQRKYRLVKGCEWFEGDVKYMKKDIDHIIENITNDDIDACQSDEDIPKIPVTNQKTRECFNCGKGYVKKQSLLKHLQKCNGISNPLQCHKCHRVFFHRANKSRHLKICKGQVVDEIEELRKHFLSAKISSST